MTNPYYYYNKLTLVEKIKLRIEDKMNHFITIKIDCSAEEKEKAKKLAKSKGMTFSGWLGQLIKRELTVSKLQTPSSPVLGDSSFMDEMGSDFNSGERE